MAAVSLAVARSTSIRCEVFPAASFQSTQSPRLCAVPRSRPRDAACFSLAQSSTGTVPVNVEDLSSKMADAQPTAQEIMDLESRVVAQTYGRTPLVIVSGNGCKMTDINGKEYVDMASGIAVNALGHGDSTWLEALTEQAKELAHVSNLYYTVPMVKLAERLVSSCFADRVFFVNSGTEANEAAIKFARKFQRVKQREAGKPEDEAATEFVAFSNSFHGRTMGALALTSKVQYRTPFEPIMPGTSFVPFGDLEAAAAAIQPGKTAAVFLEPVQGEGGVFSVTKEFLQGLRKICDDAGTLLVFDEVQCGVGRTGLLWAHEAFGVAPDMMTVAKPLAGGLPIGALLLKEHVSVAMAPGDHGSTFAGNPLVCATALAVFNKIADPAFLASVTAKGELLRQKLRERLGGNPHVKEVRGRGLLVGVQLDCPAGPLVDRAREEGVLAITAGKGDVVRLVPPLVISEEEIEQAVAGLEKGLEALP